MPTALPRETSVKTARASPTPPPGYSRAPDQKNRRDWTAFATRGRVGPPTIAVSGNSMKKIYFALACLALAAGVHAQPYPTSR